MPFQECPHCHLKVLPTADGNCPSCGQDFSVRGEENMVAITVSTKQDFPAVCHRCGANTDSSASIVEWTREYVDVEDTGHTWRMLLSVGSFLFAPVWILLGRRPGVVHTNIPLRVELPTCVTCDSTDTQILDKTPGKNRLRIVVHSAFANAVASEQQRTV